MTLFLMYCLGALTIILISIYMDIEHYKVQKSLPSDPFLLIGSIVAIFWPLMSIILLLLFASQGFGFLYRKLIGYLAK